jgi:hypothetical protein
LTRRNSAGLAPAAAGSKARKIVNTGKRDGRSSSPTSTNTQVIRAELTGSSRCTTDGIVAISSSPVLQLCRKLLSAGVDPAAPLHAYRGSVLALIVQSIGEAANLDINSKGTGFVRYRPAVRIAPPMRPMAQVHHIHRVGP